MRTNTRALTVLALFLAACADPPTSPPGEDGGGPLVDGGGGPLVDGGQPLDDAATPPVEGPHVHVHLRSTHAEVAHAAGTAGQTPRDWWSGVRSLHLLRTLDDPEPALIFSHGDGYVEASYADGADTIVGSAPAASLPSGTFTWARAVHTHVRFTIDATAHGGAAPIDGAFTDLIVLSDRTTIEGRARARGDYEWRFEAPGVDVPYQGTGYEVRPIDGGGFHTRVEDGETAYYFPALVVVDPAVTEDVHFIFEVNVHEGFRWTDQTEPGYRDGVFDVAWTGAEPIVQAGANAYAYFTE